MKTGRVVKLSDSEWEKLTLLLKAGNNSWVDTIWEGWWAQERSYFPIQKCLTADKWFVPSPNTLLHYYVELLSEWFRGWRTTNPQPWRQRPHSNLPFKTKKISKTLHVFNRNECAVVWKLPLGKISDFSQDKIMILLKICNMQVYCLMQLFIRKFNCRLFITQ